MSSIFYYFFYDFYELPFQLKFGRAVISQISVNKTDLIFVASHTYPQLYYGHEGWQISNEQLEELCLTHNYGKGCHDCTLIIKELDKFNQCNPGQKKNLKTLSYQIKD